MYEKINYRQRIECIGMLVSNKENGYLARLFILI